MSRVAWASRLVNRFVILFFASVMFVTIFQTPFFALSATDSLWVNNGSLSVGVGSTPLTSSVPTLAGQPCFQTKFKVKKFTPRGNNPAGQTNWVPAPDQEKQLCAVHTPLGFVSQDPSGTYIQFTGSSYAQKLFAGSGGNFMVSALPIPGKRALVVQAGTSTSYSALKSYLFYNIAGVGESAIYEGELAFRINAFPSHFTDQNNEPLGMTSFAFSSDGEWMIAIVRSAVMRIHVRTKAMQSIARGSVEGGVNYTLAISNDGRYAFAQPYHTGSSSQKIYDLANCQPSQANNFGQTPEIIPGCTVRDISQTVRSSVSGLLLLQNVGFSYDGQVFSGLATYRAGSSGPTSQKQITITRQGYTQPTLEYLGMGDSFSSGEGDGWLDNWYEPDTDTPQNKCHVSRRSYPYLLATQLGLHTGVNQTPTDNSLFHNVACMGALSKHIDSTVQFGDSGALEWFAGSKIQNYWVSKYSPSTVTLTMIGNDIGFSNKLKRCLDAFNCYSTYESRLEVMKEIEGKFSVLTSLYQDIKSESSSTKIYVLGYPQLFSAQGQCATNVRLSQMEREFSRGMVHYLNTTIKSAAENAGVVYVDVENAFTNRQLCEGPSDTLAVNGLTPGDDIGPLGITVIGNESYHPNPTGHVLLAEQVSKQTDGLTKPMPSPNSAIKPPDPLSADFTYFLDVPKENRPVYSLMYEEELADDVIVPLLQQDSAIPAPGAGQYELVLYSEPLHLGTFTPDTNGNLNLRFSLPATVPAGFHTLHLFGKSASGENLDIYKTIYVASSATDFDGDGILNTQDTCDASEPSSQDIDKDGVGDACDGFIDKPPPEEPTPQPEITTHPRPKPQVDNPETIAGDDPLPQPSEPTANNSGGSTPATDSGNQPRGGDNEFPETLGASTQASLIEEVAPQIFSAGQQEVSATTNTPQSTKSMAQTILIVTTCFLIFLLTLLKLKNIHKTP